MACSMRFVDAAAITACQLLLMFYMYTLLYMLFTLCILLNRDSE